MKKIVTAALILISVTAFGSEHSGVLKVESPIEISLAKGQSAQVAPGEYKAHFERTYTKGFLGIGRKEILVFKIETAPQPISGTIRFEKRKDLLLGQDFSFEDATTYEEKPVTPPLKETRSCVVYSFSTEENCRQTSSIECSTGWSPDISGSTCIGSTYVKHDIVCDTVNHEIKGLQDVVFQKTSYMTHSKKLIKSRKDGSVLATLTEPTTSFPSENIISKTRCI